MAAAAQTPTQAPSFTTTKHTTNPITPAFDKPHHVQTVLKYYKDPEDGSPPHPSYVGVPESYNRPSVSLPVTVTDISGHEHEYTLDSHGFQIHKHVSKEKTFLDEQKIKQVYYQEVEELLKDVTGATQVYIFDHTIRRPPLGDTDTSSSPSSQKPDSQLRGPVQRVHIDQTYKASENRVLYHLPDQAETLLKGRYQIINVWRPIKPIYKDPLAVADARSVPDSDLVTTKLIYPDRVGETYTVRPNENHRWYFRYGQTPEEVMLIKCFDSKVDGRARRVPHSAFVDEEFEGVEGIAGRESIEVRTLVFQSDDTE